jgi:hypothetical protein
MKIESKVATSLERKILATDKATSSAVVPAAIVREDLAPDVITTVGVTAAEVVKKIAAIIGVVFQAKIPRAIHLHLFYIFLVTNDVGLTR